MGDAGGSRGAGAVRIISCLGVDLEMPHLPHFLAHYVSLGVAPSRVHMIVNSADPEAPGFDEARRTLATAGAPPPVIWVARYTSDAMWEQRRRLQAGVADPGDWIVNADIDEHHVYPAPLADVIAHCEAKGHNAVQGVLLDRLAPEGRLAPVRPNPSLAEQFPLRAEVDLALAGRGANHGIDGTVKLMLHRHDVLPSRGGHNPSAEGAAPRYLTGARLAAHPRATDPAFRFAFPFQVNHYKWTDARQRTLDRRIATPGASPAGIEIGGKIAGYLAQHGRIRLGDVAVAGAQGVRLPVGWKARCLALRLAARLRAVRAVRGANAARPA